MKKILSILVLLCVGITAYAVETRIVGEVWTAETGEPIAGASVFFKGSKVGTTTNGHGQFYLHIDMPKTADLTVSCIGYKTQKVEVQPGQDTALVILLQEKKQSIEEVVILPGENPALTLMENLRTHRKNNQPSPASYTAQTEQQYFLSGITAKHLKRRIWQSLQSGMLQQEDSTFVLPLPKELQTQLTVPLPEHLDFYQSTLTFGGLSFLSPTAASAPAYYRYFLVDSLPSPKQYIVHFKPKNSFDPLFVGSLTVDSATYAIAGVEASIPKDANVNYLSSLHYDSRYDGRLTGEQMTAVMDLAVRTDSSHIFPTLLACQRYTNTPSATDGRIDSLKVEDQFPLALPVDTPPLIRFATWLGQIVHTGYIPTGTPVDIGNIIEILQINRYEGLHMGLPFRTNSQLFPHVSLEGYLAYGIRDRGVKYKTQAQVLLPTDRRNIVGVSWGDHYVYSESSGFDALLTENSWGYANMPFTTYILADAFYKNSQAVTTAVRKREFRLWSENEWFIGHGSIPSVQTTLSFQTGRMGYGDARLYHYYDMPSFRYNSLSGVVRMGWQEQTVDLYLTRKYLYSSLPTLFLGAEMGSYQLDSEQGYHMYGKLEMLLRQDASLGMGGTLSYALQAGVVLGQVPYPLLNIFDGNQSYSYAPHRFTLMNNQQFAADRYLALHLDWNGQGILFNRIPGIRYLRLRELAEFKLAYGGLSKQQTSLNREMEGAVLNSLNIPYVEMGVGIGNILRIGEVYSVWRLTHRDDPAAANWAIRFRFHLGL